MQAQQIQIAADAVRIVLSQMEQCAKNALGLDMVGGSQKFSEWSFSHTDARAVS